MLRLRQSDDAEWELDPDGGAEPKLRRDEAGRAPAELVRLVGADEVGRAAFGVNREVEVGRGRRAGREHRHGGCGENCPGAHRERASSDP